MFRVTRYPMISKTESGRVGYRKKYRVAGRVRVPAGHCLVSQLSGQNPKNLQKSVLMAPLILRINWFAEGRRAINALPSHLSKGRPGSTLTRLSVSEEPKNRLSSLINWAA